MRRFEVIALGLAASLGASTAFAQSAEADALFRQGRALMEAGDATHACPKFAESLRLEAAPGTSLNLAGCEEQTGKLASALRRYERLVTQLAPNDDRRPFVLERMTKLERRVPRLAISLIHAPANTVVVCDDVALGATALGESLPVNPGAHSVVVVAPGRVDARYDVTLREGEQRSLTVAPGDPRPTESRPTETTPHKEPGSGRTVGWIVGGVGALSLAGGSYFGARALGERSRSSSDCAASICRDPAGLQSYDDAKTHAHVADVLLGVGVLAVGVAVYLVLSSPGTSETPIAPAAPPRAALRVTPFGIGATW